MIIRNEILCVNCGDVITSEHTHDYKACECGRVSVDGGKSYLKRCGDPEDYLDLSVVTDGDGVA